jgi:hypothetical protein
MGDTTNFRLFQEISLRPAGAGVKKRRRKVAFASSNTSSSHVTTGSDRADKTDVALEGSASHRTAWLFTRGDSSVTMSVTDDASGIALVVRGPGEANATYRFTQRSALTAFAEAQEQKLLDQGFQLQAVAERRSERGAPRPGMPDRRRPKS